MSINFEELAYLKQNKSSLVVVIIIKGEQSITELNLNKPGIHDTGASTALLLLIRWAYLIRSSDETIPCQNKNKNPFQIVFVCLFVCLYFCMFNKQGERELHIFQCVFLTL